MRDTRSFATEGGPQGLEAIFPRFALRSVVAVLCAAQVIVYMISCWVVPPRAAYTPNYAANWKLGASDHTMDQCAVQVGGKFIIELRRFFTPIFLHHNIMHLVGNISVQVTLGPRMLATYGAGWYVCLFLASGACGNILSDAFWVGGLGASTGDAGLIGALLAQIWLVWGSLGEAWKEWARNVLILAAIVVLIVEAILWNVVNHYGHFGGLLGGFAIAVILTHEPPLPLIPAHVPVLASNLKKRKEFCSIVLGVFTIACLCKIFVWDPPPTVQVPGINGTLEVNGTRSESVV